MAIITFASRILGMVRDSSFAFFFGAGEISDAWNIAFMIPNLSRRLFGEGAASASFIPVYKQELTRDPIAAKKFADTAVSVIAAILVLMVLAGWLIMGTCSLFTERSETRLIMGLSSLMLPYMVMICVTAILSGILNVHGHFAAPAAAPIVWNIYTITATVIAGKLLNIPPSTQLYIVAAATLLSGITQYTMQVSPLKNLGIAPRLGWDIHSDALKKMMLMMGPMILGMAMTQINTLAGSIIAKIFSSSPEKGEFFIFLSAKIAYPLQSGSVTHLSYAQRLYQFPLGVLGISLATAIFPVLSASAAIGDYETLRKTVARGIKGAIAIAMPATIGLMVASNLIISVLFQHGKFDANSTHLTSFTLSMYSIGLCGYFSQQILTRAFYSMQDSSMPAKSAIIAVCTNLVLNLTLIWVMGTAGLALSTAICSYLQVVILTLVLRRKFGHKVLEGLVLVLVKTSVAGGIMAVSAIAVMKMLSGMQPGFLNDVIKLIIVLLISSAVYIVLAYVMKIRELTDMIRLKPTSRG